MPTLVELAQSDEGREVMGVAVGTAEIGRSILTTPEIPADRLAALRRAFRAMLADPEFIAYCEQRKLMLDPGTGEDMDKIVRHTLALPAPLIAKIREMME